MIDGWVDGSTVRLLTLRHVHHPPHKQGTWGRGGVQGTWGRGGVLGTWGRGSVFSHMPAAEPAKQIVGNPSDKAVFTFCNLFKDIEETRREWPQLYIMYVRGFVFFWVGGWVGGWVAGCCWG
jgi:hypothetical protein